jgi:hypothetical protein
MLNPKKFKKIQILLITIIGFFILNQSAFAFDYQYKNTTLSIESGSKKKVDIFFLQKIKSTDLATRYIKALKKLNYPALSLSSQNIVDYFLYRLELYI